MPNLYILRPNGKFSDSANYIENPPFPAPEGCEWVEGEPNNLQPYVAGEE